LHRQSKRLVPRRGGRLALCAAPATSTPSPVSPGR